MNPHFISSSRLLNGVLVVAVTLLLIDRYRLQLSIDRCESSCTSPQTIIETNKELPNRQLTEIEPRLSAFSAIFSADNTRTPKLKSGPYGDNNQEDVYPKNFLHRIKSTKSKYNSDIEEFSSAFAAESYDAPFPKGKQSTSSPAKSDIVGAKHPASTQLKQGIPPRTKLNNPPSFVVGSSRQSRTTSTISSSLKNRSVTSLRPTTILRSVDGSRDDNMVDSLYAHMFWGI